MALEVEDGTGKANAESYISAADAGTYHTSRGNAAWADLSEPEQEAALRRATDYMLQTYRQRWSGYRKYTTQALDWPRLNVEIRDTTLYGITYVETNVVPAEVKRACAELALRASEGALLDDLDPEVTSESVGSISVTYAPGARQIKKYPAIDRLLGAYLCDSGSGTIKLERA
jgi:hypothetical protein